MASTPAAKKTVSEVVKLTKRVCDEATTGTATQRILRDKELTGFGLVVGKQTKTFFVQRRVAGGRVERVKIDLYGRLTVDQARQRAAEMLAAMGKGESQRRKQPEGGITLKDAWELHRREMAKRKPSDKTLKRYQGILDLYLTDWMTRPLREITRADVRQRHEEIKTDIAAGRYVKVLKHPKLYGKRKGAKMGPGNRTGESTANDTVRLLRAIWNTALREDEQGLPANPALQFRGYKLERHELKDRVDQLLLSLQTWHTGVLAVTQTARRDALLFMLFTGMRKEAATSVRWEDIDFERRTLRVPKPKGGTEKAFALPLSDYVVDLLQRRQKENAENRPKNPWVFPTDRKLGHMREARADVGVPFTPHDLRRVFSSVAAKLKVHPYALKLLLNHSLGKGDVTMGYVQMDVDDLRAPMQQITDRLRIMCEGPEPVRDNVGPIAPRKRAKA